MAEHNTDTDHLAEQVDQLKVSSEADQANPSSSSAPSARDIADDVSTASESSEEDNQDSLPRQELEMVISALQTSVKTSATPAAREETKQEHGADELHSGDDHDENENDEEDLRSDAGRSDSDETSPRTSAANEPYNPPTGPDDIVPPTPGTPPPRNTTYEAPERLSDDIADADSFSANLIALHGIDLKEIKANPLTPREQEKAGTLAFCVFSKSSPGTTVHTFPRRTGATRRAPLVQQSLHEGKTAL